MSLVLSVLGTRVSPAGSAVAAGLGTHGQAAPVGAAVHPLHVHHRPEKPDVVVDAAKCLHALEQLDEHTQGHRTAVEHLSCLL